ncbi:MAG: S-methyl-5-thioribose-1-phosphate isomerase [Planctomycetales bacterium]|nr:S-methyl-5-thioribose-1-phosphate isomerase [Planctomycetales bacterium]
MVRCYRDPRQRVFLVWKRPVAWVADQYISGSDFVNETQILPTLRWEGPALGGSLVLVDQTRLPGEAVELTCTTVDQAWDAIKRLVVRGAPAIGVAAAYAACLALRDCQSDGCGGDSNTAVGAVRAACDHLATSRPTAVNLFWALDRMRSVVARWEAVGESADDATQLADLLLAEARAIHDEDAAMCAAIGRHGADALGELPVGAGILTHCNAGALATGGDGTALAVIFELARRGRRPHVWVDETRPLLQGARLTAWELLQRDVDCTLICDSMAAAVMQAGRVSAVVTGADRIAANGDAANKIGTYGVATLAAAHGIPFYIAAPTSTFDLTLTSGADIPIEERASEEITHGFGRATAPAGVPVFNPAFDVTPARLIRGIITERGVIAPVERANVERLLRNDPDH